MARAIVNLTCQKCGKSFSHIKHDFRKRADADQYEKWAESNITTCPDCYKEEQKPIREAKKAQEKADEFIKVKEWEKYTKILPALTGTENQIKWASVIRYEKLQNLIGGELGIKAQFYDNEFFHKNLSDVAPEYLEPLNYIRKYVYEMTEKTTAKFWIDNKDEIKSLDATYILQNWKEFISELDAKEEKEYKIKEIESRKPDRPECLQNIIKKIPADSFWNGKLYGTEKYNNFCIYINSVQYDLTIAEAAEIRKYLEIKTAWNQELEGVKNGK